MKFKRISALLLSAVLLVSGCSKTDPNNITDATASNGNSEISDPMKQPTSAPTEIPPATTYGFNFKESDIEYLGDQLVVAPTLMGGDIPTSAGFVVFIDGIPQKYASEGSSEYSYINSFDIEANSEKIHRLTVDAVIDQDRSEHYILLSTILVPEFVPPLETPSFGNYHRMLHFGSKSLSAEIEKIARAENASVLQTENRVLTKEDKAENRLDDGFDTGYIDECDLRQNDRLERTFIIKEGEKCLTATLNVFSTTPAVRDYRVTVFVNNKPVKINGGYDNIDVTMEGGKISKTDITIDNIKIGDFVYCIAVPMTKEGMSVKTSSKMVVGENAGTNNSTGINGSVSSNNSSTASSSNNNPTTPVVVIPPETSALPNTTPPSENTSSSENSNNSDSTGTSNGGAEHIGVGSAVENENLVSEFAIGDYLYASTKRGSAVYPALCKVNSSGEVLNTLGNVINAKPHNERIAVIKFNANNDYTYAAENSTSIMLLDMDLNVVKSLDITGNYGKIDFDESRIVYVNEKNELCSCDWFWKNHKPLFSLSDGKHFTDIKLGEEFIAFSAQADIDGMDADYYGICDFSGNYDIYRKDGINYPQVCGKTAVWGDRHTDVINGVMPSGEFVMYAGGSFKQVKTENVLESQNVFLTGENEFFTVIGDSYGVIKQYKNNTKIREISIGNGNSAEKIVHTNNALFAVVIERNGRYLNRWELD